MIAPDARLRCRPTTRSVAFPRPLSTGPYPVTSTWTTAGDTCLTSAAIESLNCRNGLSVCAPSARAGSAATKRRHAAARHCTAHFLLRTFMVIRSSGTSLPASNTVKQVKHHVFPARLFTWQGRHGRRVRRSGAGPGPPNHDRDVIEILRCERDRGCANPAVDLLGGARTDNRAGDTRPRKRPRHGDGGHRRPVASCDRSERIAQQQIPAQARLPELG